MEQTENPSISFWLIVQPPSGAHSPENMVGVPFPCFLGLALYGDGSAGPAQSKGWKTRSRTWRATLPVVQSESLELDCTFLFALNND